MTEKKHAKFSASGASRWLNCAGSISLCETVPKSPSSKWADEGTRAHECLEAILKNHGKSPYTMSKALEKSYPKTMVAHALRAYEEIILDLPKGAELLCETKVSLEFIGPEMFGTVDAAIVDYLGRLTVVDFKYGAGFIVEVKDNPQLAYYALGIAHQYDYLFDEIELKIIQPRSFHKEGPVRSWVMDVESLHSWGERFKRGVDKASNPKAVRASGYWCKFCPAKNVCPEYTIRGTKDKDSGFSDLRKGEI